MERKNGDVALCPHFSEVPKRKIGTQGYLPIFLPARNSNDPLPKSNPDFSPVCDYPQPSPSPFGRGSREAAGEGQRSAFLSTLTRPSATLSQRERDAPSA